jgi:hypothetical protein
MAVDDLQELFRLPAAPVETRWATAENPRGEKGGACRGNDGRKRMPCVAPLKAGASYVLAEATGTSGTVRRVWITIGDRSPKMLRGLRLDFFWDGARTPAVSVPIGDFFGHALGRMVTFQNALFSSPEGRSFNACVPMPFRSGMRVVATNETDVDLGMFFYEIDYTLGDAHDADTLYFHSHWQRENPTTLRRDYEILPRVAGRGRYLGATLGVAADSATYFRSWWGEGEVKVYLDGDTEHPTLCGTGTEDYIGTGWGQGQYASLHQGCPLADGERMQYGFYRLHLPDPVWFRREARVTIQQIGCWDPNTSAQMHGTGLALTLGDAPVDLAAAVAARGYGLFERRDDWSSCAYFYLDRPENGLPPLPPAAARTAGLGG